jgi:hypothetical protein
VSVGKLQVFVWGVQPAPPWHRHRPEIENKKGTKQKTENKEEGYNKGRGLGGLVGGELCEKIEQYE